MSRSNNSDDFASGESAVTSRFSSRVPYRLPQIKENASPPKRNDLDDEMAFSLSGFSKLSLGEKKPAIFKVATRRWTRNNINAGITARMEFSGSRKSLGSPIANVEFESPLTPKRTIRKGAVSKPKASTSPAASIAGNSAIGEDKVTNSSLHRSEFLKARSPRLKMLAGKGSGGEPSPLFLPPRSSTKAKIDEAKHLALPPRCCAPSVGQRELVDKRELQKVLAKAKAYKMAKKKRRAKQKKNRKPRWIVQSVHSEKAAERVRELKMKDRDPSKLRRAPRGSEAIAAWYDSIGMAEDQEKKRRSKAGGKSIGSPHWRERANFSKSFERTKTLQEVGLLPKERPKTCP